MPALNFQKQFAADVEKGKKLQTIRACRKDKRDPKPGDTLYLYTGMRTKACRKLKEVECKSVSKITIYKDGYSLSIYGRGPQFRSCNDLARRDGFADFEAMRDWFDKTHGLPFEGYLIKWGR